MVFLLHIKVLYNQSIEIISMKLSKLMLLIPALLLGACSGNTWNSSSSEEKDPYQVSEERFNSIFLDLDMFINDNVIMTAENEDGDSMIMEADNGVCKLTPMSEKEDDSDFYFDFLKNGTADIYSYDHTEEKWVRRNTATIPYALREIMTFYTALFPFRYSDFEYYPYSNSYKRGYIEMTFLNQTLALRGVEIKFENDNLQSAEFRYGNKGSSKTGYMKQAFSYGGAKVTLPVTE